MARFSLLLLLLLSLLGLAWSTNPNCALILPSAPLTAKGLSTPFYLTAVNPAHGNCTMSNPNQRSFVQGIVLDTDTGDVFVYNPLVIDQGSTPAVPPVVPRLPPHPIVALWFGTNAQSLRLVSTRKPNPTITSHCVMGTLTGDSPDYFGQFSYCNAPAFFEAAFGLIQAGKLVVPPLGTGFDGQPCPTVRDFGIIDQDQSDNVVTTYLLTKQGKLAQNTTANRKNLVGFEEISNGSDNFLLSDAVNPVLGCKSFVAPDLADPGTFKPALPLNELSAMLQASPVALVPAGDPMVLTSLLSPSLYSLQKTNAYRVGVAQPPANTLADADTVLYCQSLASVGASRLQSWETYLANGPSLDPATSTNLIGFLVNRYINTWGPDGLNCIGFVNMTCPITAAVNSDGLTTGGIYDIANMTTPHISLEGGLSFDGSPSSSSPVLGPLAIGFVAAVAALALFTF